MRIIYPYYRIEYITPEPLKRIEQAGRTCYKSEDKITEESAEKFVRMVIKRGHESVIEHPYMTVRFVCDRGVTHEIVRHRLCAYSQESTRYCNYSGGVTFIIPPWSKLKEGEVDYLNLQFDLMNLCDTTWLNAMKYAELAYKSLLNFGQTPQQARAVLPNSLKTEIVWTANLREWRHIFKLRANKAAHPQMQEIMIPLLAEVKTKIPVIFEGL